jgi:tetratricopeptide (TPR) repeat protein
MRVNVTVILLALLWTCTPASAQQGDATLECYNGVREACWVIRFGRCANENPQIAIPACTRQLANPTSAWTSSAIRSFMQMDRAQRFSLRATAHAKLGNAEQALEDYDRAIRTHGELFWIHALRASALFAAGFEEGALASFNDAINLEPDNAILLNGRARLLSTAMSEIVRNRAQAIADAQKASELEPNRPNFVTTLATIYAESGEFDNAAEAQQRAIEMLEPADQITLDDYRGRLALYEQGMSFDRPIVSCDPDSDPTNPDSNATGNALMPYLAFCFETGGT